MNIFCILAHWDRCIRDRYMCDIKYLLDTVSWNVQFLTGIGVEQLCGVYSHTPLKACCVRYRCMYTYLCVRMCLWMFLSEKAYLFECVCVCGRAGASGIFLPLALALFLFLTHTNTNTCNISVRNHVMHHLSLNPTP